MRRAGRRWLIAEEVAEVFPALVDLGSDGEPYSVKYELLTSVLISELKRQRAELARQRIAIEALEGLVQASAGPP